MTTERGDLVDELEEIREEIGAIVARLDRLIATRKETPELEVVEGG